MTTKSTQEPGIFEQLASLQAPGGRDDRPSSDTASKDSTKRELGRKSSQSAKPKKPSSRTTKTTSNSQDNRSTERVHRSVSPNGTTERNTRSGKSNGSSHRKKRPVTSKRPSNQVFRPIPTHVPRGESEPSVLNIVNAGRQNEPKRSTERYAFEVFSDQKMRLKRIKFLIEENTGTSVSVSKIIRDALDSFLQVLEDELLKS